MESEEDKTTEVDLLHTAVHQLLEHRRMNRNRDREESLLLSRLICQLESLEEEAHTTCLTKCPCGAKCYRANQEAGIEEIAREIRSIKKQNLISHCLLAVMIIVTAAWQLSEVSLLLSVKEKLCNPFKAVGTLLRNSIKWREKKAEIEGATFPFIGVPQVPDIDLAFLPLMGLVYSLDFKIRVGVCQGCSLNTREVAEKERLQPSSSVVGADRRERRVRPRGLTAGGWSREY